MAEVILDSISKVYSNGYRAVDDLSLDIADGEFLVLVGPSGCGKTTALRMVAGLEDISAGELRIGTTVVNDISPKDRDIAMVFQSYALYPHMTVAQNIAYGMRMRRVPKDEIAKRVDHAAKMLDLVPHLSSKPKQLSGGQRQRVAMGRAIVRDPQVFLMDEPLSNLDAKLRVQMRSDIAKLQRELGTTTIYVTHDQIEAMTMGDRVAVMKFGVLQQCDTPQVLYDNPDNLFVAGFIGSPPMNMAMAQLDRDGDTFSLQIGAQKIVIDAERIAQRPGLRAFAGRKVAVGVRAEDMEDASIAHDPTPDRQLLARVLLTEALGSEIVVRFGFAGEQVRTEETEALAKDQGVEDVQDRDALEWVASFGPRSRVARGDDITVAVDTRSLHFFDPENSQAIRD